MGAYYNLGIIQNFTAQSNKALSEEKWKQCLNDRINLDLFEIKLTDGYIKGVLKDQIFEENIEDFYNKLKEISLSNEISYYFSECGTNPDSYRWNRIKMYLCHENVEINISIEYISLFVEGKVLAEEFSIEPRLINWLFRHSNIDNCLAGAIISAIN